MTAYRKDIDYDEELTEVEVIQGSQLKKGDTQPDLIVRLIEDDVSKDLSGFTPTLKARNTYTGHIAVNNAAQVQSARNGIVKYDWQVGDTQEPGIYAAEITIDDGNGTVITFPNARTFLIVIEDTVV
jgi:hypothetical protein